MDYQLVDDAGEESIQDDQYSTQAVWGSPEPSSSTDHPSIPKPPSPEHDPSTQASTDDHAQSGQHSFQVHPGEDFLLYDSWKDEADYASDEELPRDPESLPTRDFDHAPAYEQRHPHPPRVPTPPTSAYNHLPPLDPDFSPPLQRYSSAADEAWNASSPTTAEQRSETLRGDIPDLKKEREFEDKMEVDLEELKEKERGKKGRGKRRRDGGEKDGKNEINLRDRGKRGKDRDEERGHGSDGGGGVRAE